MRARRQGKGRGGARFVLAAAVLGLTAAGFARAAEYTALSAAAAAATTTAAVAESPVPGFPPEADAGPVALWDAPSTEGSVSRARVTIGGWARVAAYAGRYDGGMPLTDRYRDPATGRERDDLAALWENRNRKRNVTRFATDDVFLTLDVAANERMSLHVALQLDDADNGVYEQDDFLHALYFEMRELWGKPITARVGKQTLPFGVRRDELLIGPYIADRGNSGFAGEFGAPAANMDAYHPAAADKTFAAVLEWKPMAWRDLLVLEAGVFQEPAGRGVNNAHRRSRDDLLFRSFVGRMRFSPLEKMELSAGFLSRYRDDGDGGRRNHAWSVGLSAPLLVAPVQLFAEYQRSWRDDFIPGQSAEDLHAGAVWSITPLLRLHAQYEWLKIRRRPSATANGRAETARFHRTLLAVEYELSSDITLEAGWQREWYKRRGAYYSDDPSFGGANLARFSAGGDVFYAGMKYSF